MINSYLFKSIDDAIYEDDYTYYYDEIEEKEKYDSNEVPVLDQVQMLELGLLTEDGWNITAVTHGSYRWIIMLEKCFVPKMKPRKIEKIKILGGHIGSNS